MNVIYLDQNVVIDLVENKKSDPLLLKARNVILELVQTGRAVFPYSEIHLAESEPMDAPSRQRIGAFWDTISKGYRFIAGKEIRTGQFQDVFHQRPTRFRPDSVLYHDRFPFAQSIEDADMAAQAARAQSLREVVEYWATLKKTEIDGHIRTIEAAVAPRLVMKMFGKMLAGGFPSLGEIHSEYNTIASDLAWQYHDQGQEEDALFRAVAFMRDNALSVPAMAIECAGLEALAEQYAFDPDNRARRAVEKSQLDHDSNDLAALSNFVPYCVAGISDGNAVNLIKRAYGKIRKSPPTLFVRSEIGKFLSFLEALPFPEAPTDPLVEAGRAKGRCLILVRWKQNELLTREELPSKGGIRREMLPHGGLKIWSETFADEWHSLLETLEETLKEQEKEMAGEAIIYGGQNMEGPSEILFQIGIPCGLVKLRHEELNAAFAVNSASAPLLSQAAS